MYNFCLSVCPCVCVPRRVASDNSFFLLSSIVADLPLRNPSSLFYFAPPLFLLSYVSFPVGWDVEWMDG